MVEMKALLPYPVTGETTKRAVPGQVVVWDFNVTSHAEAEERDAELMLMVPAVDGWPDPMKDYKDPKVFLDDLPFDYRHGKFKFPSGGSFDIRVEIELNENTEPKGRDFIAQMYVWPYYRP